MEIRVSKSERQGLKPIRNNRKKLVQLFGSVRLGFEPKSSENPESLGTLVLTALSLSPVTGQKPVLTPYLTTVGKLHNRV